MNRKQLLYVLAIFVMSFVSFGQELPDVEDLNVDTQIGEINSTVDSIPDTLDNELIPNETATQLFSYMKWMFNENTANELLGQTLAPLGIELFVLLLLAFTFTLLWLTIRMLVLTWRLILFIIGWIIKLIELIPFFE